MKAQIPWLRVFVEGVVIVGSILLAFGIDAWWEEHSARVEMRRELGRVHEELVADRDRIFGYAQNQGLSAAAALEIIALLDEGGATVEVPDSVLRALLYVPTYESQTSSLDGLLSSGRVSTIEDFEVRAAIAGWDSALRNSAERELNTRAWTTGQVLPALAQRGDVGPIVQANRFILELEEALGLPAGHPVDQTRRTSIRADPELEAVLSQRALGSAIARNGLLMLIESSDALVEAIRPTQDQ